MYRNNQALRLNEEVVPDGWGGHQIAMTQLRSLTVAQRADCEEGLRRFLTEQAILFIPTGFSHWARMEMEVCIRGHDVGLGWANQRTFIYGFLDQVNSERRPNYLSIHVLRCIFFKHTAVVERILERQNLKWMLSTEMTWDGMRVSLLSTPGAFRLKIAADRLLQKPEC